jgi:signal transduction histidine kinase
MTTRSPASYGQPQHDDRYRFLAEASSLLAASLDYEVTLSQVARLVVPRLADWAVVDAQEDDGSIHLLTAAHVNPAKEPLIHELRRLYPPNPLASHGLAKVLRTGKPELYPSIRKEWKARAARDDEHLRLITALGAASSLCVPLVARGRTLGAITLVAAESRRRYSDEIVELAEELAYRCAIALDNARLVRQLHEALAAREAFLASASHDLKNPIAAIQGYAQLLQFRTANLTDPTSAQQVQEVGAHIESSARRMTGLINELIDVSRLDAGEPLPLHRRPMDLLALAHDVVAEQQQSTDRHEIRVEGSSPEVWGVWDPDHLRRVIENLLSNAIKYSPDGGPIAVTVGLGDDGGRALALLSVADSGIGIPQSEQARVFEPFHRADNADRVDGTGIGLASVRDIVEQHGGQILLESEEGAGTRITILLPIEDPRAEN